MFGHRDGAVVKKVGITFTLKVKVIFNALFLFNRPFWGVFKVPNVNIYGVRVLWLRQ